MSILCSNDIYAVYRVLWKTRKYQKSDGAHSHFQKKFLNGKNVIWKRDSVITQWPELLLLPDTNRISLYCQTLAHALWHSKMFFRGSFYTLTNWPSWLWLWQCCIKWMKFYPQAYVIILLMVFDVLKYQQKETSLLKGQNYVGCMEENSHQFLKKQTLPTVWLLCDIFSKTFQWEIKAKTSIKFF